MKIRNTAAANDLPSHLSDDALWTTAKRVAEAIKEKMAPAGALGLPPLLDKRRLEYGIPNEAFEAHALFDRVLVWQIEGRGQEGDTFAGTRILKPETAARRIREEMPRGIVVTAGLEALDALRSNGVDLGHIVGFMRLAPWRKPVGSYEGHDFHLLVLRAGDLIDSEDLQADIRARRVQVTTEKDNPGTHVFVDDRGKAWDPKKPFIDESY